MTSSGDPFADALGALGRFNLGSRPGTPSQRDLLRVSDADRREVADALAEHFGAGRLDQAEFDERLDLTMRAKTRADLAPLLTDLPALAPTPGVEVVHHNHRRHPASRFIVPIVLLLVVVQATFAAAHAAAHVTAVWIVIALMVVVAMRHHHR